MVVVVAWLFSDGMVSFRTGEDEAANKSTSCPPVVSRPGRKTGLECFNNMHHVLCDPAIKRGDDDHDGHADAFELTMVVAGSSIVQVRSRDRLDSLLPSIYDKHSLRCAMALDVSVIPVAQGNFNGPP